MTKISYHSSLSTRSKKHHYPSLSLLKYHSRLSHNSKSTEYKAHVERCCEELLTLEGYKEDINGLAGRGQAFLRKEEWEDAVSFFGKSLWEWM